jgi:hypothetical protein
VAGAFQSGRKKVPGSLMNIFHNNLFGLICLWAQVTLMTPLFWRTLLLTPVAL